MTGTFSEHACLSDWKSWSRKRIRCRVSLTRRHGATNRPASLKRSRTAGVWQTCVLGDKDAEGPREREHFVDILLDKQVDFSDSAFRYINDVVRSQLDILVARLTLDYAFEVVLAATTIFVADDDSSSIGGIFEPTGQNDCPQCSDATGQRYSYGLGDFAADIDAIAREGANDHS